MDIDTAGHTQLDGAVIANIREDGTDGGNLSLTTDTLTVTDIHDRHTEDSHYTRISGSWESEGASQSRGSDSDYTQTTGKPRGDETGDSLDERTTWGIEGSYSSLDREQINRGTLGQGEITVNNPDSDLNTDLAAINRDIDRAQQITRDESETTELYVTETSVEDATHPVDTANRWGEQLQDLPERYIELPQEVLETYDQFGREITALTHSAPGEAVEIGGEEVTEIMFDALIREGHSVAKAEEVLKDPEFQARVLANAKRIADAGASFADEGEEPAASLYDLAELPSVSFDAAGEPIIELETMTVSAERIPTAGQVVLRGAAEINAYLEEHAWLGSIVEYSFVIAQGPKGGIAYIAQTALGNTPVGDKLQEWQEKGGLYLAETLEGDELYPETDDTHRYLVGGGNFAAGIVLGGGGRKGGGSRGPDSNHSNGGGSDVDSGQQSGGLDAVSTGAGRTDGVVEGETGAYVDLSSRSAGDGLTPDHIPSFASVKENLRRNGVDVDSLSDADIRALRNNTNCVVVRTCDHQAFSRTYGGRNNQTKIQTDANDLRRAADADLDAWEPVWRENGWSESDIARTRQEVHELNRRSFEELGVSYGSD